MRKRGDEPHLQIGGLRRADIGLRGSLEDSGAPAIQNGEPELFECGVSGGLGPEGCGPATL